MVKYIHKSSYFAGQNGCCTFGMSSLPKGLLLNVSNSTEDKYKFTRLQLAEKIVNIYNIDIPHTCSIHKVKIQENKMKRKEKNKRLILNNDVKSSIKNNKTKTNTNSKNKITNTNQLNTKQYPKIIIKEVLRDGRCGYRAFLLAAHKHVPVNVDIQKGKNAHTLKFLTERRIQAASAFIKYYNMVQHEFWFPNNFDIKKWIENMTIDDSEMENLLIDKFTDEKLLIGFTLLYETNIDIYDAYDLTRKPFTIQHPFLENVRKVSLCFEKICSEYGHYDMIDFI